MRLEYNAIKIYTQNSGSYSKSFKTFEALKKWAELEVKICPSKITVYGYESDLDSGIILNKWEISTTETFLKSIDYE